MNTSAELKKPVVFRHTTRKLALFIVACLFVAISTLAVREQGAWIWAAVFSGFALVLSLRLASARLEITEDKVFYRGLEFKGGSHSVRFADIQQGYFEEDRRGDVPVAVLCLQLRDGQKLQVPIRLFPIRASAFLFAELGRHGIPITEPVSAVAQQALKEVRGAQIKF